MQNQMKKSAIDSSDVIRAYQLVLNRLPENNDVIQAHLNHRDLYALGTALIKSDEYKALNPVKTDIPPLSIYQGYSDSDLSVFDNFRSSMGASAKQGFIVDFLGIKTRDYYAPPFMNVSGAVLGLPIPGDFHAETAEWLGVLKCVSSAVSKIRVLELGAGWGPWLIAAGTAARLRGITDISLYGIEADKDRFEFMQTHFADNGFSAADHHLSLGAVGAADGIAKWPVTDNPTAEYGARPLEESEVDYRGNKVEKFQEVKLYGIKELLKKEEAWDLIHIDIQGGEFDICNAARSELNERARWVVIGTHSRLIEGQLHDLFRRMAWDLVHDKPCRFSYNRILPTLEAMTSADGIQVWSNPRFG